MKDYLVLELEHLKIETRLITEMFEHLMDLWTYVGGLLLLFIIYYKSRKREIEAKRGVPQHFFFTTYESLTYHTS
jgi:hypothetical protein